MSPALSILSGHDTTQFHRKVILRITSWKEDADEDRAHFEEGWRLGDGPIPAEILGELRWGPGLRVSVDSEDGIVRVEPVAERPPDDVAEFVARFTKMYDQAPRNLAERWAVGEPRS